MKILHKALALFLILSLLFSIAGCQKNQTPAEPTVPPVTEPPEVIAYRDACAPIVSADSLLLRITATKTTTVGGETFVEESDQTLRMSGIGTDAFMFHSEEDLTYGDAYEISYEETFANGTVYMTQDNANHFSGAITVEEAASRYCPAVLLDTDLYGSITQDGSVLTFSAPTAAESWAMPADAEMTEASGTASLDSHGQLQKATYSLSYHYGPTEVTLEVESYITIESVTVEVPENVDDFVPVTNVDAIRLIESAYRNLFTATSYSITNIDNYMVQAAGLLRNEAVQVNVYGSGDDFQAKLTDDIYFMDYSRNREQEYSEEYLFRDGVCTVTADKKKPQEYPGVTAKEFSALCDNRKLTGTVSLDYFKDAVITDLGSTYIVELTFTEEMAELLQDSICTSMFNDPDLLNNMATSYVTNDVSGYFAVDKYTGIPTAHGYRYEGCHTIDEQELLISYQADTSVDAPSLTTYYAINEEMLPEEEPETKATPLFYHVTGPDGQQMWLFGTIHVGDERTAYLPQEIYDALSSSDALALEYYSKEFEKQLEKDKKVSEAVSDSYYYSDGTKIVDVIGQELYDSAVLHMKASGNYNMNADYMKAYLWSQSIDNFHRRQSFIHTGDQGVESRLETLAEEQGIKILSIESGLFQVQMITGLSDKLQIKMLEESIEYDATDSWDDTSELYELWCAGDEAALREELSNEVDTSEMTEEELAEYEELKPLMDEYNTAISYDRNENMLKVAIEYLESGKTVFYAVGLAHLLDDQNGLVDALRAAGYTVELVQYAN